MPFAENDEAKQLGARWDPGQRRWYAPRACMAGLARWAPRPPLPDLLPGEDRSFGSGLFVDLVPASCWFTNVRSGVAAADWDRVRRMVYRRAGDRCEACGRRCGPQVQLEAHERWYFDDVRGVQMLRRLVSLCALCHLASHYGRAATVGDGPQGLYAAAAGHGHGYGGGEPAHRIGVRRVGTAVRAHMGPGPEHSDGRRGGPGPPDSPARRAEIARERLATEWGR